MWAPSIKQVLNGCNLRMCGLWWCNLASGPITSLAGAYMWALTFVLKDLPTAQKDCERATIPSTKQRIKLVIAYVGFSIFFRYLWDFTLNTKPLSTGGIVIITLKKNPLILNAQILSLFLDHEQINKSNLFHIFTQRLEQQQVAFRDFSLDCRSSWDEFLIRSFISAETSRDLCRFIIYWPNVRRKNRAVRRSSSKWKLSKSTCHCE